MRAILLYIFESQKLIPPCPEPTLDFLYKTDSIIHELIIYLIFKGNSIIYQSFDDEQHRMAALSLFAEDFMYGKILFPFYKFIIFNRPKPTSLRQVAQVAEPSEIFKAVLHNRSLHNRFDPEAQPIYLRKLILDSLSCDHLTFNIARVLSTDNKTPCQVSTSKLMAAAYAVAHRGAIEGVLDQFLESFITYSEGFLEENLVTLFNE